MRIFVLFLAVLTLAACNTVAGLGEDVAAGARSVQRIF
ncbi:MAG: entericidin EcnA/B family protein [Paracoccaceae bacterium]